MNKLKKIRKSSFFMFGIFLVVAVVAIINVSASEKSNDSELRMCTISDEYLEWEKLSEKEKANVFAPPMCDYDADRVLDYSIQTFSDEEDDGDGNDGALPTKYDGRLMPYASSVKDQKQTNSCWAFSTTSALEYFAKKKMDLDYEFSPRHLVYSSVRDFKNGKINEYGFNRVPADGGNFFGSTSYFVNSLGPVLESDMPFENNENTLDISEIQNKNVVLDVNDTILKYDGTSNAVCTADELKEIKEYVYEYGSVVMSTHMDFTAKHLNSITGGYYYNGSLPANHAVLIVGWDDEYSKNNFPSTNKPSRDGAFIVQNSYGTSFADNGYYYVSYEDVHICNLYMVITSADEVVEDNFYGLDKLGTNMNVGFSFVADKTVGYAMNVFRKEEGKKEILKEVTFASTVGTYDIYFVEGHGKTKSVSEMTLVGSGESKEMGYLTYSLEKPILLESSVTEFSIVVRYDSIDSTMPIPVSGTPKNATTGAYMYVNVDSDRSFASSDGTKWSDLKTMINNYTLVASIKAYTDDFVITSVESETYKIDNDNKVIYVQPSTSVEKFSENIQIKLSSGVNFDYQFKTNKIFTGLTMDDYLLIVLGDVNGDGATKMNDVMQISQYIVDNTGLEKDFYMMAADVNNDGFIRMNDVMKISSYIVEGGNL